MRSRFMKSISLAAAFTAVLLAASLPVTLRAQESRGKITGTVTDPNKAAVPGATVTIVDPARGTNVTLTTNDDGFFQALYLLPGTYQVIVENAGFKKFIQENVILQINETRDLTITLELGGAQETVTVMANAAELNTADANLGQTVDQKRLAELPLVHGDPYTLIGLSPGVTYTGSARLDRPFEPTHIVGYAMEGTRGNRSDLLIDGAPSTATANGNEVIASYVPPSDITQEFKVQTSTYDAQFGNTEGGVTSIAIKSGENQYHGSAYYWIEPGGWAANDFFGNARRQGRPFTFSNRPGFYLSGPVTIPKVYDGKNKTFFLFAYEGIRDSRPRFDTSNVWVPTDALKNGDFSSFVSSGFQIYDPTTGVLGTGTGAGGNGCAVGAVCNRTAFAGGIIPANRINPVSKAILSYFGQPKQPGLLGNINDSTLAEKTRKYDNFTVRIDRNFTEKDRFFARYSWYTRDSSYNNYTGTDYVGDRFGFVSKQAVLDEVHTFDEKTVLNVSYGFNRFIRISDAPEGQAGFDLTSLGFPAYYNDLVSDVTRRFPRLNFNCTSCTGGTLGNGHTNERRPVGSHFVKAVVNRAQDTHSLKFGGEMRIYREDDRFASNDQTGQYTFDNTYTRAGSASSPDNVGLQAFAAFLLGYPTTTNIVRRPDYSEYSKTWGFFVNDDWRVTNNLSLTLGLRYEFETPLVERQNKSVSGFDFDYVQPIEASAQANYAALNDTFLKSRVSQITARGGLLFAGKDTGSGLYNTPKNGFLPRFGFAYSWNDRTVVRGGFGLFQGFLGERRGDVIQPGYSLTTAVPTVTNANGTPIPVSISTPFPNGVLEPTGNTLGRQTALGQAISFFNQNPKVSKQARWSIGLQRELWGGWVVQLDYVGNRGYDIEITKNINALPNQYLSTDASLTAAMTANSTALGGTVANPFAGLEAFRGTSFFNSTISRSQLLRPFPQFGDINTTNNDGNTWYHSGQLSVNKRFSKGVGVQFAYTRSKWLQATEYLNAGDEKPTKMISDQDSPNRFTLSGFWALPVGKGQPLLSNANWLTNAILGGWQLEGTYSYQSGFPLRFANDAFYVGGEIGIPRSEQTVDRWFNTDAFLKTAPVSHLRTLPFYFPDVRLDPINNADLGLRKDVHLKEQMRLQFRVEFLNAFNHPLLPGPNVSPTSSAFGTINSQSISNQLNYARRAQLAAKFLF